MTTSSPILRRTGVAGLATAVALGVSGFGAGAAQADAAQFSFTRVAGPDRYATSAAAAQSLGNVNTVILASGEDGHYPDALTANYLAGLRNAPILLTHRNKVPDEVKKQIADSGAKNVIIVGGTSAVSQGVQNTLDGTYTVTRVSGANRYATASKVIDRGHEASTDTALLATGLNFPDALSGGALSYNMGMPLAITRPDDIPNNVLQSLKDAGIKRVLVLGGDAAVSQKVVDELNARGIDVTHRFDGKDRAETSVLIAEYEVKNYNFDTDGVTVASGDPAGDGVDALSGGPLTAKANDPMLITKTRDVAADAVLTYLKDHSAALQGGSGTILGGPAAVSDAVMNQMTQAVLGSGAEIGNTFYNDVDSALAAAKSGDTVHVFGTVDGFTVGSSASGVTITGDNGAQVSSAITVRGADNVTIQGLSVKPGNVEGQLAAFYLDNVDGLTLKDNKVTGTTDQGVGVVNATAGDPEAATIEGNTFTELKQGVFANPTAAFVINDNTFDNNTVGSANDEKSTITGNTFRNNDEGVGMSVPGSMVTGNYFVNNSQDHVGDYTADKSYDLEAIIDENTFRDPVKVNDAGTMIVDAS